MTKETSPTSEHDYKIVFLTDAEAELADKVLKENHIFHSAPKEDYSRELLTAAKKARLFMAGMKHNPEKSEVFQNLDKAIIKVEAAQ